DGGFEAGGFGSEDGGVEAGGFAESVGEVGGFTESVGVVPEGGFDGGDAGASSPNDPVDGTSTAKDPTAAASLAISVSRSLAIAFPADAAMSDLIAELSGAV